MYKQFSALIIYIVWEKGILQHYVTMNLIFFNVYMWGTHIPVLSQGKHPEGSDI